MTFLHGILFFLAVFVQMFLLAFQSRNVNSGKYLSACGTAVMINALNIFYIRSIALSNPWTMFYIGSIAAPSGIILAMVVHHFVFKKLDK